MIKRITDIILSFLALFCLSPIFLIIYIILYFSLGTPVLFRQIRPGLHAKPFQMIKFRTMRHAVDTSGQPLPDADRLTPFGRWLRSTSLDELPGFWNVLKSEMSLVGPRPLLMEYLPLYSTEQAKRNDMRPGITGWTAVSGRNALSWEDKFKLDVWYVENQSFWLDIKILALTVLKVVRRDGISAAGEATMPKFTGSHQ
jgi:lipopolysaccharide/colanic/teichoic acid biosynthesis glycosyltransferase